MHPTPRPHSLAGILRLDASSASIPPGIDKRSGSVWIAGGLLAAMIGTATCADVPFMAVLKGQHFEQTGTDLVALKNSDNADDAPLVFEAFAQGMALDSLVSGNVQIPGGVTIPLAREYPDDVELRHRHGTESLLDMDTARSNGTYTFHLTTKNDGEKSVSLSLEGDSYPNIPQATNFTALQAVDHSTSTTVQWSPMTGGTTMDFIMCSVYEKNTGMSIYQSGAPGAEGALNGESVSATIPADTLQPGLTYDAEVLFVKVVDVDTTSYPGALAVAGYYKQVHFAIKTTQLPGVALGAAFESALPQSQSWEVGRDSAISFRFSHPMNPGNQSVSWTGVNPSNFSYQWLDGNKVLLCRYNVNLPADAEVGWSLNLSGFHDAADFALAGTVSGSFHTSSAAPQSPPDVQGVYVLKARGFQQTGTSPVSSGMYGCDPGVDLSAYNRVKAATLTVVANGRSGSLLADAWNPGMTIEATYASKDDLDRFIANGDFTFDLTTMADGVKTVTLSLGATDDYPAAPTVTNLPALQTINPAVPTTITWDALAGWSATETIGGGLIELEIQNSQKDEVYWIDNSQISSSSQCTIPAGILWPGRTYRVNLRFIKIKDLDNTSYAGVMGGAGFSSITEFAIQTSGNPVMPTVTIAKNGDGMNLNFTGGEPQRNYVVEASRDLQRWLPLAARWMDGGSNSYYDDDARYLGARYYRLREGANNEWVQSNVTIQGTVWTDSSHTTPVAGAVVSTDLDAQTTVTDHSGRFFLETDTPSTGGMNSYTITVTHGATHKDFGPGTGDQPRNQTFEMN